MCPGQTGTLYRVTESNCLNIGSLFAFGAGVHVERNLLAFFQGFETIHVDSREVSKQIFAAFIGSDKTKTFCIVKPFYSTGCHETLLPITKLTNKSKIVRNRAESPVNLPNHDVLLCVSRFALNSFYLC